MPNTSHPLTAKSSILALAMLLAGAGGSIAHAAVTIDCDVPLQVECTVTEPQGIQAIVVQLPTPFGIVNVVDETYSCVTTATVSWDPIVPGGEVLVSTCNGGLPPKPDRAYAQEALTYDLRNGVLSRTSNGGALNLRRPGIRYALRAPVSLVRTAQSFVIMRMLPVLGAYTPGRAEPTLTRAALCCDAGTLSNCFAIGLLDQCGEGLDFVQCYEDDENQQSWCDSYPN
ncbi:MAG TPA: hypothetical protein VNM90_22535 [Haliangium sp.]|nr:hypothetical protein [Haliangium sp.]